MWVALLLTALVILAVGTVLWGLSNAERQLTAEAERALAALGLPVSVEISGRDAVLSGEVNAADQARAIELVRGISGIRQVEWESMPTAAATSTTTRPVETTVTTADPGPPPTTSTTTAGSTTTDVSVLDSSDTGNTDTPLPRTGSESTLALVAILALLAGVLLVRRARGWDLRNRKMSDRVGKLRGLTATDGSEIYPRPTEADIKRQ